MASIPENRKFVVKSEEKGIRLDLFLSEKLKISRSQVKKAIDNGLVLVNKEKPRKAGELLHISDSVEVKQFFDPSISQSSGVVKTKRLKEYKIDVIEQEKYYVIINKPANLLTHPTEAHEPDTLVAWLFGKYPEISKVGESKDRPGIVHRLDKEASGLLVIARTQKMYEHLKRQFQARCVEKIYKVLVYGNIEAEHGVINFEIDRGKDGRMVSRPRIDKLKLKNVVKIQNGKEALTEFWVEKRFKRFTLLRVKIHTGRTHQIRVHMFAFGHLVVGDTLYFNKKLVKKNDNDLGRLFLHAEKLCFEDLRGEKKSFRSDLPKELLDYILDLK